MFVFVYGTLKKGNLANMHLEDSVYIGSGETVDLFDMYDGGYPKLTDKSLKQPAKVVGEVYEIDSDTFEVLDNYEGYPILYTRKIVPVMVDETQYDCIIYLYNRSTDFVGLVELTNGKYVW